MADVARQIERRVQMSEIILRESTQQFLQDPLFGGESADAIIRHLLKAEYLRNLNQYRRVDRNLSQKYGVSFNEFVSSRMVQQKGYSWEAESDAMDWETAISGIKTVQRKLSELQDV